MGGRTHLTLDDALIGNGAALTSWAASEWQSREVQIPARDRCSFGEGEPAGPQRHDHRPTWLTDGHHVGDGTPPEVPVEPKPFRPAEEHGDRPALPPHTLHRPFDHDSPDTVAPVGAMDQHASESEDLDTLTGRQVDGRGDPAGMGDQASIVLEADVVGLRAPLDGQVFGPEGVELTVDNLRIVVRTKRRGVDQLHDVDSIRRPARTSPAS